MQTNVQKWGNSLAIRIPSFIASKLSIANGDSVYLTSDGTQITIRPKNNSLAIMLNQITKDNVHNNEWEDFSIKGKEVW